MMGYIVLTAVSILWASFAHADPAQFTGLLTDSVDYTCVSTGVTPCTTWPLPAQPAFGSTYVDPLFGTTIKRINAPTVCDPGVGGWLPCEERQFMPNYPKQQAWNADGTKYVLTDQYSNPILYSSATDAAVQAIPKLQSHAQKDLKWSNSDPDLLYVAKLLTISSYVPSTDTLTALHNFTCTDGTDNGDRVDNGDEGNSSYSDRYWALRCYKAAAPASGKQLKYFTYDAQTDTILADKTPDDLCGGTCPSAANNKFVDWMGFSPSGDYVIVNYTVIGNGNDSLGHVRGTGTELFDKELNYIGYITNNHEHQDIGYDVNGVEVLVGMWESTSEVTKERLGYIHKLSDIAPTYVAPKLVTFPCTYSYLTSTCGGGSGQYNQGHISMRASQDVNSTTKGWALWSSYRPVDSTGRGWGANELFAVKIDSTVANSTTWHRIGRTMSIRNTTYNAEPHATVNRDWTKVLWGSNWNTAEGPINAYMITLDGSANPADLVVPTTTANKPAGRYAATQTVTLSASETATTRYCFGAGCTPSVTYSAPFKVLQNLARQTYCYASTDAALNAEATRCVILTKQRRR